MPVAGSEVRRDGNRILFFGRVNAAAYHHFLQAVAEARAKQYQDLVLDFGQADTAFPVGMVPILAAVDSLRREDFGIEAELPTHAELSRLFHNANWAHLLQPERYENYDVHHVRHVATQRFGSPDEQQALVNAFLDIVMREMVLSRDAIAGLEWSINEITDNVLNHAQCQDGGIVQVTSFKNSQKVAFCVADSGRGILASLREGHPHLRDDEHALAEAVKGGVTRNPDAGQGNGLTGSLNIGSMSGGLFEVASGKARLTVTKEETKAWHYGNQQRVPGTIVYVEIGLGKGFQVAEALGVLKKGYQPVDVIETNYMTDSGDATLLRLKDEATGFGSRPLGAQIRLKCQNLLNAESSRPLLLDWTGVPLVSSSFADEFVGKLFLELGPLGFSSRVRQQGLEPIVRALLDKAIVQRMMQARGTPLPPSM